jgi:hypothetical protein
MQPNTSEQTQEHWRVNLIQFEIFINKHTVSALISSASEDGVRASGDVVKAEFPVSQLHIP